MTKDEEIGEDIEVDDLSAPFLPQTKDEATVRPERIERPPLPVPRKSGIHPAFYIAVWISFSSGTILFNKYILGTLKFPIILTTWHLTFATIMTQLLARCTRVLDSRKDVPMTPRVYIRTIVPIGLMFSLSLICGNVAYIYLSVSFIQMLKATTPVAVLLATWSFGIAPLNLATLGNVSIIVVGVAIASLGEVQFNFIGFLIQMGGIVFEAVRLTMVQHLLSSAEFKMDPLVSLYYFAPVCAIMNAAIAIALEAPKISLADVQSVGIAIFLANATVAFGLNVAVVFLIGQTSSLVLTLSGVLKDILLVMASVILFGDPVSGLQIFGYSIALAGLVYYKLGPERLKAYANGIFRKWLEPNGYRRDRKRVVIASVAAVSACLLLGGACVLYYLHAMNRKALAVPVVEDVTNESSG
ncbi:hypothetical protein ANO11243_018480 [Dothideomycetidae sp. 11243]|nr:hypothetical protein ANO11243_018480 [fungal sp. No.11243]